MLAKVAEYRAILAVVMRISDRLGRSGCKQAYLAASRAPKFREYNSRASNGTCLSCQADPP